MEEVNRTPKFKIVKTEYGNVVVNTKDLATPRPWKIDANYPKLVFAGNRIVEQRTNGVFGVGEKEANASLIVKAVNNHEALLEACLEALNNLDRLNDSGFGPVTDMASNKTYQILSQAIQQAEKK